MRERNISNKIVDWYEQYINNRIATVKVGHASSTVGISRGCPQGGCLSTLGWNFVFDELLEDVKKHGVNIVGFAEDACLLVSGDSLGPLYHRMNMATRILNSWAITRGLEISAEKTVGMIFTPKRKFTLPTLDLELGGNKIAIVDETKYLAMIFNSKLNWGSHIKDKIAGA